MKTGIYSVRDINTGFNQPFCDASDNSAKRGFAYAVLNTDMMGFQPKDFDLYKIGVFDTELGYIESFEIPVLIMRATEVDFKRSEEDAT